jgi:RNA polymerase sigma-70 factor (ECF subfamily)
MAVTPVYPAVRHHSAGPVSARPTLEPPDDVLVRRARGGDLAAFETLVERHRATVFRVAARLVGDHDAEDVTQDAFLRAYHRLRHFRGEASFRTWLLRITHNSAIDSLARRRRQAEAEEPEDLEHAPDVEETRQPAERLERSERLRRLEGKLELLRLEHRTVLVLRDVEGLSYEEIADVTDMPVGSVKGRLHRARAELIDFLRRNTYDWELPR